jgi:serine/threonine protein kinase
VGGAAPGVRAEHGRSILVLENPGGEPLERLLGAPIEVGSFLRLAPGIAADVGKLHQRGLVHKDIKPAKILVNCEDGKVRLAAAQWMRAVGP